MLDFYRAPSMGPNVAKYIDQTRKWDIEYNYHLKFEEATSKLSNHMTHNFVVLGSTGATDAKLQWWQDTYLSLHGSVPEGSDSLPPRRLEDPDGLVIDTSNWKSHIQSTCRNFPAFAKYFDNQIKTRGISKTIEAHAPALLPGLVGAAVHPIIHTGFGADAQSQTMVADGLAYMSTRFQSICTEAPHKPPQPLWQLGGSGVIDASVRFLEKARKADLPKRTADWQIETYKKGRNLNTTIQARVAATNQPELPFGELINGMGPLMLGESLFSAVEESVVLLSANLLESDNEFFVIHGLNSLHAILCLMPHLHDEESQSLALTHWWRGIMAVLIAQNMPGLSKTQERLAEWKRVREMDTAGSIPKVLNEKDHEWWTAVLKRSLDSRDEHIPKAVYALSRWAAFECFSSPTVELFRKAAENAVKPDPAGKGVHNNLWISLGYYDEGHNGVY
eukprot:Clim_evm1s151 gene=Clim_evmTU1s151